MAEVSDKEYMLMKKVAKAMILTRHHIIYGTGNASESLDGSEGKKIDYIPKSVAAAKEASKYWTSVRKVLKIAGSHYNSRLPKLRGWKEIKAKRERVEIKKLK